MNTPTDVPSGAIDSLRAAVKRALEADGNPTTAELEERSIRLRLRKLPAQTVKDFLDGKTIIIGRESLRILIVCLNAEEAEDWEKLHERALRERNLSAQLKRRGLPVSGPDNVAADASETDSEPVLDPPAAVPTAATARQPGPSPLDETLEPRPAGGVVMTTAPENHEPRRSHDQPSTAHGPVVPPVKPRPEPQSERGGRRKLLMGATAAVVVLVAVGVVVMAVSLTRTPPKAEPGPGAAGTSPTPGTTARGEIKKGPESAGILTWVEAPVDGTQVGVDDTLAETISVWSQPGGSSCPSTPCNFPSPRKVGVVTHGQTIKVVCVTTGQKFRNGTPGALGFHEDDRWVQLASNQGINGIGYLSNIYFARDKLPSNLAECTTS
jgi:hypothetical protein